MERKPKIYKKIKNFIDFFNAALNSESKEKPKIYQKKIKLKFSRRAQNAHRHPLPCVCATPRGGEHVNQSIFQFKWKIRIFPGTPPTWSCTRSRAGTPAGNPSPSRTRI